MIDEVMNFLRSQMNQYMKLKIGTEKNHVVFIGDDNTEAVNFTNGSITPLLINLEEERTLRSADPYATVVRDGLKMGGSPEIRLNLFVLFVAKFTDYTQSMKFLSLVIKFFQSHHLFDHKNAPELSKNIEKLVIELTTMPFSQQNEVWNALRTTYLPSVLYKVKMVVIRDEETLALGSEVADMTTKILAKT